MGVVNADLQYNQQQITAVGKMASSRVPVTLRDFFFDDAFFKSTWDDFEKVRENMFRESRDMWKKFEEEFNRMESSMASNMLQSSSQQMLESSSSSNKKSQEIESKSRDQKDSHEVESWGKRDGWMFPSMFNSDFAKQLDLFQTKDSEVIRMKDDDDKFEVSLDTSQYRPDELRVNVGEGMICVEGKHEENSEDGRKMVFRQFSRKYSLPAGAKADKVVSNLSSDGVLVVSAPKQAAITNGQRSVPIQAQ